MSYYTELMRAVVADGRKWYRTNSHGETTEQPPFVVVHVALAEHRINARRVLAEGRFTSPLATYARADQ